MAPEELLIKKRNRVTLSCSNCKKRKVKCSRGWPCSSCIRYRVGHTCTYPGAPYLESQWADTTDTKHLKNNQGASFSVHRLTLFSEPVKPEIPQRHSFVRIAGNPTDKQQPSEQTYLPLKKQDIGDFYNQTNQVQGSRGTFTPPEKFVQSNSYNHVNGPRRSVAPVAQHEFYVNQEIKPQVDISATAPLHSELEVLKSKIKEIESSLHVLHNPNGNQEQALHELQNLVSNQDFFNQGQANQSIPKNNVSNQTIPNQNVPSQNVTRANSVASIGLNLQVESSRSNSFNGMTKLHSSQNNHFSPKPQLANFKFSYLNNTKDNVPIQLPPINWKPETPVAIKEPKKAVVYPGTANWQELRFDPSQSTQYIGVNPYFSDSESLDLYSGYSPIHLREARRMNYGPFSWLSIMKKDDNLSKMLQYMMSKQFESVRNKLASGQKNEEADKHDELHFKINHNRLGASELVTYKDANEKQAKQKQSNADNPKPALPTTPASHNFPPVGEKSKARLEQELNQIYMNKHAISLGLTFYDGKIEQEMHLIEKLKLIIPKKKVIWLLLNKFFVTLYPFMPFIDEVDFKAEIMRMIGDEDYRDEKVDLKVEKRLDFAYMGILLFILRLVYLSLLSNRKSVNEENTNSTDTSQEAQDLKYLLSNSITIHSVEMARLCMDQFDLFRKSNLVILQCALFMRMYNMCSPEDGDGVDGGDSQIFNGTLVQIAYSIGINREPSKFEEFNETPKTNNLIRKIWYYLVSCDLTAAHQHGNPIGISDHYYDTEVPFYQPGNENCNNIEIEKNVISTYRYFAKYLFLARRIIKLCLNIQIPANVGILMKYVSEFEIQLDENYGTLSQFLTKFAPEIYGLPFIKIQKCRNYINMKTFLHVIYYQLHLHYVLTNQQEYAYFYLRKCFVSSALEFLPELFKLIFSGPIYFGDASEFILNPVIEALTHKTNLISFSILIKLNDLIYTMRKGERHEYLMLNDSDYNLKYVRLLKLTQNIEIMIRYCVSAMARLSNRYYYAWRITKAQTFLTSLSSNKKFYEYFDEQGGRKGIDFTLDQVTELSTICEASIDKLSQGRFYNKIIRENLPSDVFDKIVTKDEYRFFVESPRVNQDNNIVFSSHSNADSASSKIDFQELDEFQAFEDADVDRLWYQMANFKNITNASANDYNNNFTETPAMYNQFSELPNDNLNQNKVSHPNLTSFGSENYNLNINPDLLNQFSFNPVFDMFENYPLDYGMENVRASQSNSFN